MSSKKHRKSPQPASAASPESPVKSDSEEFRNEKGKTVVFHAMISAAAVVVVLGGIKCGNAILAPILLALFVTIILLVPLRWLQSKGCPAFASFLVVASAIMLLFGSIAWMIGNSLDDFIDKGDLYTEKIASGVEKLELQLHKIGYSFWDAQPEQTAFPGGETESALPQDEISPHESNPETAREDVPESETGAYVKIDTKTVVGGILRTVKELRHLIENAVVVLIILMFMVFEAARFPAKLQKAFGGGPLTNEHFRSIAGEVRRYVLYKGFSNAISVTLVTVFYYCIGVPYALLWGFIAFFLYFIPNIGAIIAAVPPLLLIFIDKELGGVVTLVVGLSIIEMFVGYGIEPKLLGRGLGISAVVVFVSLIFWGWLLGPIGLFLAAPLTIIAKIVLQTFEETRWIAVLLAENVPNDPPARPAA